MTAELNAAETARFDQHDALVRDGFTEFARVGNALLDAQDRMTVDEFKVFAARFDIASDDLDSLMRVAREVLR